MSGTRRPAVNPPVTREDVLSHLSKVFYEDLGLCGCGNPDESWALVHEILGLAPLYQDGGWQTVANMLGRACHLVLSLLNAADLLEHGGSLGGSWITDKGRWLLWAIDEVGGPCVLDAELDWVGLPHDGARCIDRCWSIPSEVTG